ncbi:MAG: hypothetical protein KF819_39580 [Labilithrix sp.]|nr:hypothetical protein [Labilithrix sp.]
MPTNEARERHLLADERGAIMVMGIFMCSCMVGALWYLAGLGDAILYRERLQEAADAVAFSDAALHARGMNLIVMINLVMAVILSVRVALRVGKLAMTIAAVVFSALGFFAPALWAAAPPTAAAAKVLNGIDNATKPAIDAALHALVGAERGIASATPTLAHAGAVEVGKRYDIVPAAIDPSFESLPLEARRPSKLCDEAIEAMSELLDWLFGKLGLPSVVFSPLTEMIGGLAKASPGSLCGLESGGQDPSGDGEIERAAGELCDHIHDVEPFEHFEESEAAWLKACGSARVVCVSRDEDGKPLLLGSQRGAVSPPDAQSKQDELERLLLDRDQALRTFKEHVDNLTDIRLDKKKCVAWAKADMRRRRAEHEAMSERQAPGSTTASSSLSSGIAPMLVKDFRNGSPEGQIIGGARGEDARFERASRLVRLATLGDKRTRPLAAPEAARIPAWAQAEMFYDCAGHWNDAACNGDDEAMWHFRWRARLRRVNQPTTAIVGRLASELALPPPRRSHDRFADELAAEAIAPLRSEPKVNAALRKDLASSLGDATTKSQGVH